MKTNKLLFIKLITVICLLFVTQIIFTQTPSNNTIANATQITSLPFTDSNVNIPGSNVDNASGLTGCSIPNRTVVYKFTPSVSGTVIFNLTNPIYDSAAITTTAANENATQASDLTLTTDGQGCTTTKPKTTNVIAGQTYYYLVLNGSATSINFTGTADLSPVPNVTSAAASSITSNSASLGGDVTNDNGNAVTERGIVYSTTDQTPEIGESGVTKDTNGSGTGTFSKTISGLTSDTTYYFRAYAINSIGTAYGSVLNFTTTGVRTSSITRQNPTTQDLQANTATFQVTFSKPVQNADVADFSSNSAGATVSNVSAVSTSVYNVTLNNITTAGDVFLQIKGVDGVAGSNNISTLGTTSETTTVDIQPTNDYLNQSIIGQTFTTSTNGTIKSVTFYPRSGQHTFAGTANLKLYSGNRLSGGSLSGGTEIDSESVNITNSTDSAGQTFTFATPVSLTSGQTYTITLENFNGTGSHALESNTSNQYNNGHVIFTGMNSSSHLNFDLKIKIIEEISSGGGETLSTAAPTTNEKYIKIQSTGVPAVATSDATNISTTGATLGGNVTFQGNSSVTERGVVFSTSDSHPKIGKAGVTKNDNGSGTGVFSEAIIGLDTKNIYFYRAYATNTQGTAYGEVKRFSLNNGLAFDGSAERVTITDHTSFDFSSGFTIEGWINPNTLSGNPTIFSQYAGSDRAFAIIIKSNGTIEFTITRNGSSEDFYTTNSGTLLSTGTWKHVAFTYDGNTMRSYINGADVGTNTVSGTMHNSSTNIELGARANSLFYNGKMDEVRIWTTARSQTEIQNSMNKRVPADASNLVAYYTFNQGTANAVNTGLTSLTDITSNSNTGTLVGFNLSGANSNFVEGATGNFDNTKLAPNRFTTSGNWSNTANWSQGKVPAKIENAIIAQNQTVTLDVDDIEIDDFELETGATLNIPKDKEITVNNSFTSSGNLALESDKNDSGVLFLNGSSTGSVTYKRGGLIANEWSIVTPPVAGQTIKTFAENASNAIRINTARDPDRYAIAYYDAQSSGQWQYYDVNVSATTEFIPGQSYAMSRASDGEVSFTGTLTIDNVFKTLVADQWNAIGNPFTTYYPVNKNGNSSFLNDNLSALDPAFQSVYIWDNTQGKYVAVTEIDANNRSIPPGQGFFIKMASGQTEINFLEEKRSTKPSSGTSNFSRNEVHPEIELSISRDKTEVKTQVKFFEHTTFGFDAGFDIGNFNGADLDLYTKLVKRDMDLNFTIQSLPSDAYHDLEIPIGVRANRNDRITFSAITNHLPERISIYLEDRIQNLFTKIDAAGTDYEVVLDDNLDGAGRFYLHTSSNALSSDSENMLSGLSVYSIDKNIIIANAGGQDIQVQVYSILGSEILNQNSENVFKIEIPINDIPTGMYMVKVKTKLGQITKKILLH